MQKEIFYFHRKLGDSFWKSAKDNLHSCHDFFTVKKSLKYFLIEAAGRSV